MCIKKVFNQQPTFYYKCTKTINVHFTPTINGCKNNQRGGPKFKDVIFLLCYACISTIVTWKIISNFHKGEVKVDGRVWSGYRIYPRW